MFASPWRLFSIHVKKDAKGAASSATMATSIGVSI